MRFKRWLAILPVVIILALLTMLTQANPPLPLPDTARTTSELLLNGGFEYNFSLQSNTLVSSVKLLASDGTIYNRFGDSSALDGTGNTAVIGAPTAKINGSTRGAAYVFTNTDKGWIQEAKLVANDGTDSDLFGRFVTISEDGNTVLVGAPQDQLDYPIDGSVYVFVRKGDSWTQQERLNTSDEATPGRFGDSIALSHDGNLVFIGSPGSLGDGKGAVYVFTRVGDSWTKQSKLTASDGEYEDYFGQTLALSDDNNTLLIGAFYDTVTASDQGSVYVFTRVGDTWKEQTRLIASDAHENDTFGFAIALNGNGTIALVGSPFHPVGDSIYEGSVYIFTQNDGNWTENSKLTLKEGRESALFGSSVALNNTGTSALIGAPRGKDGLVLNKGTAYLFTQSEDSWTEQSKITAPDGEANDLFGSSVALNNAGTIGLIGARDDDIGEMDNQGSAWVFSLP